MGSLEGGHVMWNLNVCAGCCWPIRVCGSVLTTGLYQFNGRLLLFGVLRVKSSSENGTVDLACSM